MILKQVQDDVVQDDEGESGGMAFLCSILVEKGFKMWYTKRVKLSLWLLVYKLLGMCYGLGEVFLLNCYACLIMKRLMLFGLIFTKYV